MWTHTQSKIFFGVLIALAPLTTVSGAAPVLGTGLSKKTALAAGSSVSFLPVVTYDPAGQSIFISIADVNGDANPDLLVTNACIAVPGSNHNSDCSESSIGVLLGNGDGTFKPVVIYKSGGDVAYSLAVADVNGDGKPDLLVTNCGPVGINACNQGNGLMGVLLGNGDGTFRPVVTYDSGGSTAVSAAVTDVNGDGKLDLLVANECGTSSTCQNGSVGVLEGNGDGTFQAATVLNVEGAIESLAVKDVNADGKQDVIVGMGGQNNNVGVLLGNGDGTFQPQVTYNSGGNTVLSMTVADLNGDGKPDLLVGNLCDMSNNCADGSVGVLLGNGDGTFRPVVNYSSGGSGVWSLAVADLNGDGRPDLLDVSFFYNTVGALTGNGDGTFHAVTTYNPGGILPRSVAVADLNGDGKLDVAVANNCGSNGINCLPGKLGILLNNTTEGKPTTTTSVVSSLNPSTYGQRITWTAKVTSSASITPTGKVKLTWNGYTIGSAILNSNGVATLTKTDLNTGSFPLTAVYVGDAANLGSTSAVLNQVVLQTTSSAALTSSPNPSTQGQAVTFTAKISSPTVIPTGPVTFTAGKKVLGTAQLSRGKATLTISSLPIGSAKVTATYYGDSNIAKSSASVIQKVQ